MAVTKRTKRILGSKHYSKTELYNLFVYLSTHIASALKQFKRLNLHSVPQYFVDNAENNDVDKALIDWHNAIDKMIYSFDQISREYPDDIGFKDICKFLDEHPDNDIIEEKDGYTIIKHKVDYKRSKYIEEAQNAYYDRIDEGKRLFAEYFQDLWD